MFPVLIVFDPPLLKDDARLRQRGEQFPVETFIAQFVVEPLNVGLFPRRPRLNVQSFFDLLVGKPVLDGFGDKLRTIIAAHILRRAVTLYGGSSTVIASTARIE